ncbi:MAG: GTPase HflX [Sedimentisphaerales bacterium]|nr:GTPase HflX [Sedimentisphaerales bacterium]
MKKIDKTLEVKKERAILISATLGKLELDRLAELTALAETAGAIVVDKYQQKIRKINPSTYIGKGKAEDLESRVKRFQADVIIFDNDLSPGQIRTLEEMTKTKVIDRSELILDIFATRAKTRQAMLQVELAQLEYTYPRLTKMWSHLDTVAGAGGATAAGAVGAIGTRGTGEQQLEIDRRLVSKRITELKRELENIDKRRVREIETRKGIFQICLVGYTNAGKSTLMNALTDAGVFVEDRLFATLDTRTRRWMPNRTFEVLISDTVGFVKNLPHQLVASFKATLEEAVTADLLLHIIDVSNPDVMTQMEAVKKVLEEIDCHEKPTLEIFNKVDAVKKIGDLDMLRTIYPNAICISAKTGFGLDSLSEAVTAKYKGSEVLVRVTYSHTNGKIPNFLRTQAKILETNYVDNQVVVEARIGKNQLPELYHLHPDNVEIIDKN